MTHVHGDMVSTGEGLSQITFPLQTLAFLLSHDHDTDQLRAGYRKHDPLPDPDAPYPGPAFLGTPEGDELWPPIGWHVISRGLAQGEFEVTRGPDSFTAGWPDLKHTIPIAWALEALSTQPAN